MERWDSISRLPRVVPSRRCRRNAESGEGESSGAGSEERSLESASGGAEEEKRISPEAVERWKEEARVWELEWQ